MEATIRFASGRPGVSFAVRLPLVKEKNTEIREKGFGKVGDFVLYRLIAEPSAWVWLKARYDHRIENAGLLSRYRSTGYYLYGNRTGTSADAMVPSMLTFPKKAFVLADAAELRGKAIGKAAPSLGAVVLPEESKSVGAFLRTVREHASVGDALVIYPETSVGAGRLAPFAEGAFQYPVRGNAPSFCFTTVLRGGKLVTYLDGPFYPKEGLSVPEQRAELLSRVKNAMEKRLG